METLFFFFYLGSVDTRLPSPPVFKTDHTHNTYLVQIKLKGMTGNKNHYKGFTKELLFEEESQRAVLLHRLSKR